MCIRDRYIPVIDVASAMAAIVGQNFGARKFSRITGTLRRAWLISTMFMVGCSVICLLYPYTLISIFSNNSEVIQFGVIYLRIFAIGFVLVGTIMVASSAFQGLGKTYPSLVGAVVDNALFAGLVFTLPVYFSWGIQSVWWIKLATAAAETVVVALWLRHDLTKVRSSFVLNRPPAELQPV